MRRGEIPSGSPFIPYENYPTSENVYNVPGQFDMRILEYFKREIATLYVK